MVCLGACSDPHEKKEEPFVVTEQAGAAVYFGESVTALSGTIVKNSPNTRLLSIYAASVLGKRCEVVGPELDGLTMFSASLDLTSKSFDFDEAAAKGAVWFARLPAAIDADHLAYATRAVIDLGNTVDFAIPVKVRAVATSGNQIDGLVSVRDCDATVGILQIDLQGLPAGESIESSDFLRITIKPLPMPVADQTAHQSKIIDEDVVPTIKIDDLQMGSYDVTAEYRNDDQDAALKTTTGTVEVKPSDAPSVLNLTFQ